MKANLDTRKNTLIVMCGIPACGKSTFCQHLIAGGMLWVSSDNIRKELYGDESIQKAPNRVFKIAHNHMKESGQKGFDCVFDATNLTARIRKNVVEEMRPYYDFILCYYFKPNLAESVKRNSARSRNVPVNVIEKMALSFEIPTTDEGFDYVCELKY